MVEVRPRACCSFPLLLFMFQNNPLVVRQHSEQTSRKFYTKPSKRHLAEISEQALAQLRAAKRPKTALVLDGDQYKEVAQEEVEKSDVCIAKPSLAPMPLLSRHEIKQLFVLVVTPSKKGNNRQRASFARQCS